MQSSSLSKRCKKFQRILKVWNSKFQYYLKKKTTKPENVIHLIQCKKNLENLLLKVLMMKEKTELKGRGFFYLSSIGLGQDGTSSLHWFHHFNTRWTSQGKCTGRVKWRHDETWTVQDCDLFVQGDNLHAPATRGMVTDGSTGFREG